MNQYAISGNITKDPETFAPEGSEFTCIKFSIANNDERRKKPDGTYEDITSFFDLEYWTKNPQYWLQRIRKGDPCFANGKLKQQVRKKDGSKHSRIVLKVKGFPHVFSKAPKPAATTPPSENDIPF